MARCCRQEVLPFSWTARHRPDVRKRIVQRTVRSPRDDPCETKRNGVSHSWYDDFIIEGRLNVTHLATTTTLIGYARCSTDKQDLAAQKAALEKLGVATDRIYTDHGLTGMNRSRPGLDQALAAVRTGDTLVVPVCQQQFSALISTTLR